MEPCVLYLSHDRNVTEEPKRITFRASIKISYEISLKGLINYAIRSPVWPVTTTNVCQMRWWPIYNCAIYKVWLCNGYCLHRLRTYGEFFGGFNGSLHGKHRMRRIQRLLYGYYQIILWSDCHPDWSLKNDARCKIDKLKNVL